MVSQISMERARRQAQGEQALGLPAVLEALSALCVTPLGEQAALGLKQLADAQQATVVLERIDEMSSLAREGVGAPLPPMAALGASLSYASRGGALTAGALWQCREMAEAALEMDAFAATFARRTPLLAEAAVLPPEHTGALRSLRAHIGRAIDNDGAIKDEASPALAALRRRGRGLRQRIRTFLTERMAESDVLPWLQDQYVAVRHDRHCLPVAASFQNKVAGIVHGHSQSRETVFVEPASVVAWGNEDALVRSEVEAEQERLLLALSALVAEAEGPLADAEAQLVRFDVWQAAAKLAARAGLTAPKLAGKHAPIELPQLGHPLLLIAGERVVTNDVRLAEGGAGLVVSGPNAGGKTAVLTAVGLAVLMAQRGLPVAAAETASLPWFAEVVVAIGDQQNLAAGLSTFTAHLRALDDIYRIADAGALVLIDEIGASTSPREGAAIAQATMQAVVGRGASLIVSTHLSELKTLPLLDARFQNARMGLDPATLQPTYRLEVGLAGESYALDAAARLPVDPRLLAEARRLLAGQQDGVAAAMQQLHVQQAEARALVAALTLQQEALAHELAEAKRAAREQAALAAQEAADKAAQAADALSAELAAFRQHQRADRMAEAIKVLRVEVKEQRAAAAGLGEGAGAQGEAGDAAPQGAARLARASFEPAAPGSLVWLPAYGQRGEIIEVTGSAATVIVGAMRVRVALSELAVMAPNTNKAPARPAVRVFKEDAEAQFAAGSAAMAAPGRIDLRGLRVEAASKLFERALDVSLAEGAATLWVVHGHGTGALRDWLRRSLDESPYVESWRPGDSHEGGDGVTIASLGT